MIKITEWVTNHMPFAPGETKIIMIDNFHPGDDYNKSEIKTFTTYQESVNFVKNKLLHHITKDILKLIELSDLLMTDSCENYRSTSLRKSALARLIAARNWLNEDKPKLSAILDAAIKMKPYFDTLQPSEDHNRFKEYQFLNEQIFNASYGWLNSI